jgi:hypothetical protein
VLKLTFQADNACEEPAKGEWVSAPARARGTPLCSAVAASVLMDRQAPLTLLRVSFSKSSAASGDLAVVRIVEPASLPPARRRTTCRASPIVSDLD